MKNTEHDAFPVVENEKLVGLITYSTVLLQPETKTARDIMEKRVIAVTPEMDMEVVARLLFRTGFNRVPVVDSNGSLKGLLTNQDIIRAHIERVTPKKINEIKNTIERKHNV